MGNTQIQISSRSNTKRSFKPPPVMTAHKVDRLTQVRRAEEQRVSDLLRYSSESQRLTIAARNEAQVPNARKENFVSKVLAENMHRQAEKTAEEERRKDLFVREKTELFEKEQEKKARERERIEREIQRICDTSEELKELERNLKIAYVNKERAAQHQESLLIKTLESAREQATEEKMELDRRKLIENEVQKDKRRRDCLVAQKIVLQKQMRENEVRCFRSSRLLKKS